MKIDLDYTFTAQCERSMFPFVVFFCGILQPDSHADMELVSKFSRTLCLHPFARGESFQCMACSGRLKGVTAEFW